MNAPDPEVPEPDGADRGVGFDASWRSFNAVQGGVLLGHLTSEAARLAARHSPARPPTVAAVSAHFLSRFAVDTTAHVELHADRLGATSSVRAELRQSGVRRVVAQVLLVTGTGSGTWFTGPGEQFAGPDDGEPLELPADYVPVGQKYEIRALGRERPLGGGTRPRLTGWVRLREGAAVDPLVGLGVVVDALPPSLFAVATEPMPMVTAELTVHLFGPPPPPGAWVRVDQWTEWTNGHVCVDDAVLHDERGGLVARSRQTRRLLAPRRPGPSR